MLSYIRPRIASRLLPFAFPVVRSDRSFCEKKGSLIKVETPSFELANESPPKFVSKRTGEGTFNFRLMGDESQSVEIELEPGQKIRGEAGSMIFMGSGVEMETAVHGGFGAGVSRMMTGESLFIVDYENKGTDNAIIKFGANYPSKALPLMLSAHGGSIIAQKGAFMIGDSDTAIEMYTTTSFKTGFFGGEGFILQRLLGSGQVFMKGGGSVTRMELSEGEKIRLNPGCLIAFEETVTYDSEMMKGVQNMAFSGNGMFLATLEGPGTVWIQSLPFSRLVESVAGGIGRGGFPFMLPMGGGGGSGSEADAVEDDTVGADGVNVVNGATDEMETPGVNSSEDILQNHESQPADSTSWFGNSEAASSEAPSTPESSSWFGDDENQGESGGGSWIGGMFFGGDSD